MDEQASSWPTCEGCRHRAVVDGDNWECRRAPPTATQQIVPGPVVGAPPQIQKLSFYPNCKWRCGEFSQQLDS